MQNFSFKKKIFKKPIFTLQVIDELHPSFCENCSKTLQNVSDFKNLCLASLETLKAPLMMDKVEIKEEVLEEVFTQMVAETLDDDFFDQSFINDEFLDDSEKEE